MLRPDVIFDLVADKRVLHLGCTDHEELIDKKLASGNYFHQLLGYVTSDCLGVDIDSNAVGYARSKGINNIICADITQPGIREITSQKWDYLLLGEILEHIDNPVWFLKKIHEHYGACFNALIITAPNAFGIPFMHAALNTKTEWINADHRYWFTPYTLWKVIHQAGFVLSDMQMSLYEMSLAFAQGREQQLRDNPLLLDTIVAVCKCK